MACVVSPGQIVSTPKSVTGGCSVIWALKKTSSFVLIDLWRQTNLVFMAQFCERFDAPQNT